MPARTNALEHIRINSPCNEDWDSMTGNDQVRFCGHCALSVHNFSAMTREEAQKLVAESNGRLCVRYHKRPDGTIQTAAVLPLHQLKRRASRIAAGAFSAALSLGATAAAQTIRPDTQTLPGVAELKLQAESAKREKHHGAVATLVGTITDPQEAFIAEATVTLTSEESGEEIVVKTDEQGEYKFYSVEVGSYKLKVESPGFESYYSGKFTLEANIEQRIDARLDIAGALSGVVVIILEPTQPLVQAASKNDLATVKQLLAAGADVNLMDEGTKTSALMQAVEAGNREMVQVLLWAGADVNATSTRGRSALMRLNDETSASIVWELLNAGAKVNLKDDENNTALILAAAQDRPEVIQALLDAGAKINARNEEGRTALMDAASEGATANVKLLLRAGAAVNRRDKEGETALDLAEDNERAETIEALKAYGAVSYR